MSDYGFVSCAEVERTEKRLAQKIKKVPESLPLALFIFGEEFVIIKLMKNLLFVISVLLILAAIGAVFLNWQGGEIKITPVASPTLLPQKTQVFEPLPTGEAQTPLSSFQKPVENAVFPMPVFNYHQIRPMPSIASSTITDRAFTVSPEGLEAHLKYFRDNDYRVISIYDLLNYFDTGQPLPKKAVALTFDDGTTGHYKLAFPLLKKYGVKATFFVTTGNVGKVGVLTWPQIKEMSEAGMFFGSHGATHANLAVINGEQIKKELADSKKALEDNIGKKVDLLAYPGGNFNDRVVQAAKDAGYIAALGVYKIIDQMPKARFAIRRFHADDWLESITEKLVGY